MRSIILLLLVIMLFSISACFVSSSLNFTDSDIKDAPNLITNPGFNAYSLDPETALKGWSVALEPPNAKGTRVIVDATEALEGKTSLRIDASENAVIVYSEPFNVIRYGGYYLKASAKSNSPENPEVQIRFIGFKENGKTANRYTRKIKTKEQWTTGTISSGFIRPGVKSGRLAILIPPFKEGSIWIDNAGCWKVHHFRID